MPGTNLNMMSMSNSGTLSELAELNMRAKDLITQLNTLTSQISKLEQRVESVCMWRLKGMADPLMLQSDKNLLQSRLNTLNLTSEYFFTLMEKLDPKGKMEAFYGSPIGLQKMDLSLQSVPYLKNG